ncbi:MAG: hypothetical protein IJX77_10065 [Ruminococcus sp.]|nr:hypothetical protein [Ruminococcus sp.]
MYKIINSDFIGFEGDVTMRRVDIIVDTAADIPQPESHWSVGSMALIADTKEIKVLNNAREWV